MGKFYFPSSSPSLSHSLSYPPAVLWEHSLTINRHEGGLNSEQHTNITCAVDAHMHMCVHTKTHNRKKNISAQSFGKKRSKTTLLPRQLRLWEALELIYRLLNMEVITLSVNSTHCLSSLSAGKQLSAWKIVSNDTLHCAVHFNGIAPQTAARGPTLAHPCWPPCAAAKMGSLQQLCLHAYNRRHVC